MRSLQAVRSVVRKTNILWDLIPVVIIIDQLADRGIFLRVRLYHNVSVNHWLDNVTSKCLASKAALRHKAADKKFIMPKQNVRGQIGHV
jgi:hypothetical protein